MAGDCSWTKQLQSTLESGIFDRRGDIVKTAALRTLKREDGNQVPLSSDAFSQDISTYVQNNDVLGNFRLPDGAKVDLGEPGTITVVRGIPSASLLLYLGNALGVDPDWIIKHYEFPHSFLIKSLPSRPPTVTTIRFIGLGIYGPSRLLVQEVAELRTMVNQQLQEHHRSCLGNSGVGTDRCRRINIHDSNLFTVEQQATFLTYGDANKPWPGILLVDSGRPSAYRPWISQSITGLDAQFYRITPPGSCSLAPIDHLNRDGGGGKRNYNRPDPFSRVEYDNQLMSNEDRALCAGDPFVFLSDILETSALSWSHTLSYLRGSYEYLPSNPSQQALRARVDKELLERAGCYFTSVISLLEHPPADGTEQQDPKKLQDA